MGSTFPALGGVSNAESPLWQCAQRPRAGPVIIPGLDMRVSPGGALGGPVASSPKKEEREEGPQAKGFRSARSLSLGTVRGRWVYVKGPGCPLKCTTATC